MTLTGTITLIGGIVGLIGSVAFFIALIKTRISEEQLKNIRGDRDDLIKRTEIQDKESALLKAENSSLSSKCTVLEGVVTGKDTIEKLVTSLERHDKIVEARYDALTSHIMGILEYLRKEKNV